MAGSPGALVLRRELNPGDGIVLRPGWSIHTAFMLFPIDVAFVDADQVVVKVVKNLKPFRASLCLGARDEQFLRLAEFLLTRNGFAVETTKKVANAVDLVWRQRLDVVVLDASESLSEAARTAAAIEALLPQVGGMNVCDDDRPRRSTGL